MHGYSFVIIIIKIIINNFIEFLLNQRLLNKIVFKNNLRYNYQF